MATCGASAAAALAVNAPGASTKGCQRQQATDHRDVLEEQQLLNHLRIGRHRPVSVKEEAGHQREEGQHQRGKARAETTISARLPTTSTTAATAAATVGMGIPTEEI